MKNWINKNKNALLILSFITAGIIFGLIASFHWNVITVILSIVLWIIMFALALAWVMDVLIDVYKSGEEHISSTDLQGVEDVMSDRNKLEAQYKKYRNKSLPYSLYLSTPDEQAYIEWLELLATKYLTLKENEQKEIDKNYLLWKEAEGQPNMEDL